MEVKLLDTFPHYGDLGPSEVIAMGGFGTISPEDFLSSVQGLSKEEIGKRVRGILVNAIVRGYASMTTSTALLLSVRGSRILDLYITAFPFGSYMVLSQRYVPIERPELPSWVGKDVKEFLNEEISVYKEIADLGIRREEARGVLGLGTPTHMLAVLPVESVANMIRWGGEHPEIEEFLHKLKEIVESSDLGSLLRATLNAPTMGGPFPHPFHERHLEADDLKIEGYVWSGETKGVAEMKREINRIKDNPPKDWKRMVENAIRLSKIAYLHANEFWVTFSARIPLTTFNELKRHRTIPIEVEGIYKAMERGDFYIYPSVKNNPEARRLYEWVINSFGMLDAPKYEKLYALPQSIKINVRFTLNFAQLTAPSLFYRIRSCDRAEVSMKQMVRRIPYLIKERVPEYGEMLFGILTSEYNGSRMPLPKCVIGACPEPEFCPLVKGINASYDEELHKIIKAGRKEVVS